MNSVVIVHNEHDIIFYINKCFKAKSCRELFSLILYIKLHSKMQIKQFESD
jgi:hypothetical protein